MSRSTLGRLFHPLLPWAAALGCCAASGCQMLSHAENVEGVRMYEHAYYEGALQEFQRAVHNDPTNADAYYNLASTYHQLGKLHKRDADLGQAETYYNLCLDQPGGRNHEECYRGLAVLLVERGQTDKARTLLDGWAQRNPGLAGPKVELARLADESGDKKAAQQHLIEAVTIDPNDPRALAALGKQREDAGDTAQALANYQRSLAINRFQPQVATRVAALQTGHAAPVMTPPGGTRVVTSPAPALR